MKSTRLERLAAAIATGTVAHGMSRVVNDSDEFAKEVMARALALEAKLNSEEAKRSEAVGAPRTTPTPERDPDKCANPWRRSGRECWVRESIEGELLARVYERDISWYVWSNHAAVATSRGHSGSIDQAKAEADAALRLAGYELKD